MIVAVGNDGQFARLCRALGHPEWAGDPRFITNERRVTHRDALIPLLRDATGGRTTREWVIALEAVGVPCGPINTLADVFADPHVRARGLAFTMEGVDGAALSLVANPIRMSATPPVYDLPPPPLGQDTRQVLADVLGMAPADLDRLARGGVI